MLAGIFLNTYGAVSENVQKLWQTACKKEQGCDIALCTTGIAGPTGGTKEKPVGLVYISLKIQYRNN